jgi:hypothetical protein
VTVLLLLQSLWRRMNSTPQGCWHFYEVIQEGRPCHLYFDLEYSTASNPGRDGAALVGCLCRLLQDMCRRLWGLTLLPQVRGRGQGRSLVLGGREYCWLERTSGLLQ